MKKVVLYLIFFMLGITSFGQSKAEKIDSILYYHTINSDTFPGKLPEINEITGSVSQFRVLYYSQELDLMVRPGENKLFRYFSYSEEIFFGEYSSGKKTGNWEINVRNGNLCNTQYIEYRNDTVIVDPGFLLGRELCYIGDSSIIYGVINKYCWDNIFLGLSIEFRCEKGIGCIYKTANQRVFAKSEFRELKRVLREIEQGLYNQKIQESLE